MSPPDLLADLAPERQRPLRRIEYERLVATDAFADERVELLAGVIVEMSPQEPRHAAILQRLDRMLQRQLDDRLAVRTQMPLAVSDDSLPEPDLAIVPGDLPDDAHPTSALLVVEVSGRSIRKDRRVKGDLYARADIAEYWVVNLQNDVVEVHSDPLGGVYTRVTPVRPGEVLKPRCSPGVAIPVSELLGIS